MPIKTIRNLYNSNFIVSRSIIVVSASLFSSGLAYVFQLIAGRYFSETDYGAMVSLFSLSGIVPLAILFFTNGLPKTIAEIKDIDYPDRISRLFFTIFKLHLIVAFLVFVIAFSLQNFIADYLHIEDVKLIRYFTYALVAGLIFPFMIQFLQGLQRFKALSFYTILGAITKLVVILVVLKLGLGLPNLFFGLAITTLFIGSTGYLLLRKNIVNKINSIDIPDLKLLLTYSFGGAFALIGIQLLQNIDVVLVKHFFDPVKAGIYGSTAIIGRMVFFAASPVGTVMLPICAEKYKKGEDYRKPFLISLALTTFIAGTGTLIYDFMPETIIRILFGERYLPAAPFLPYFAVFMLMYTILTIISLFLISVSRFKQSALILIAAIIQYVGIHLFHNSLKEVIFVSIFAVSIPLLIHGLILGRELIWQKSQTD